ncbi:Major facilitator superfamily domain, general substrate transporter [Metarhizium album ARSEF 1941]|uniref:Major facilitator superfamily domain, general substrate transporter n=1 Tax=Metarhizium album (strain ARSEF 1941) TaxID=1081103 RepID=A0A0B2X0B5_METAS|nr:Major facilitator superfamily domain, general substrate transporter [Metarhizium album ARSEF 1941]KHN99733.1 Major facilitator superfamily domain, general substrate transporter [Metarhizium album ARSEF 1941]
MAAEPSPTRRRGVAHDASEETPLLQGDRCSILTSSTSSSGQLENDSATPRSDPASLGKPLPKVQIALLCYARMMEPIAFFSIFPFIAQMVKRNGNLTDSDVGFYSGLIESIFSATQTVVLIFWGRLADKVGRKPMLICSLCGLTIGPILFGVATTIGEMILFRSLAGVFSGSSLILRTMVGDHSTSETQAVAFSWFAFAGNMGIFLGPIIGGALADPANQYPSLFAGIAFFENYPYALPGLVVGAISVTAALTSMLFLEETLNRNETTFPVLNGNSGGDDASNMTICQLVKAPGVSTVLWIYGHVMFLAFAFTAILPIELFTPIGIGGLGFSAMQISIYLAAQGASQAIWLLFAFPFLQHRLGTKGVLQTCAIAYPLFFAGYIVMNLLLRDGGQAAMVWFWILGSVVAFVGPGVSMAFTGVQLALNDVSPASQQLGTLNGIALTCTSAVRSVVPGVATAVYAVGVRHQIIWGQLAWVILIPISTALTICLRWLRNDAS